jgi:hypothetical protein
MQPGIKRHVNGSDKLRGVTGDPDMERLGHLVAARRQAVLGSRDQAHKVSGLHRQTWYDVETGVARSYTGATKSRMMTALGWTVESWESMLAGGDPVELEPAAEPQDVTRLVGLERRFDLLEAAVQALLSDVAALRASLRGDPPEPPVP